MLINLPAFFELATKRSQGKERKATVHKGKMQYCVREITLEATLLQWLSLDITENPQPYHHIIIISWKQCLPSTNLLNMQICFVFSEMHACQKSILTRHRQPSKQLYYANVIIKWRWAVWLKNLGLLKVIFVRRKMLSHEELIAILGKYNE